MKWFVKEKKICILEWHKVFLFFPTKVCNSGEYQWLTWIERKYDYTWDLIVEYREINKGA